MVNKVEPQIDEILNAINEAESRSDETTNTINQTQPQIDETLNSLNETEQQIDEKPVESNVISQTETHIDDLPRQVHVHDPKKILGEYEEDLRKHENLLHENKLDSESTTVAPFLTNDHSPHLPRVMLNEEITETTTIETSTNAIQNKDEIPKYSQSNIDETNNSISNITDKMLPIKYRELCWRLPKSLEPSLGLVENKLLYLINFLPEFLQTVLFGRIGDRETSMNTIWFFSLCSMSFILSLIFLLMATKRLKQSKHEREIRARCQQLQQYNNQIELERATFEKQNQKLYDEIDELRNLPVRDADEEIFELRESYQTLQNECKNARTEKETLYSDINSKQMLISKYELEIQKQTEIVANLNDEILRHKNDLEKERETISRLQSNDLSLERFDKLQQIINELKSEITQLKKEKFSQDDQLNEVQQRAKQLDLDNNELTIKMKQLKDLLKQRDETIARIKEKMLNDTDDDQEKATELEDLFENATENNTNDDQQQLLSNIDNDVKKANQHMRHLHNEIDEKTRRVKDLDMLLNQEKDRCRELETKLKVVLELRERDAHLHIRQLGQTDAELRKARTDTERVRILQQQLELKQQQLDDVQKVLTSEQTKSSEEYGKLQHQIHEKWMEVKRVTRELDGSRKECEGLRRQITKYAHNERSSLEKTMHKPVPQHLNNSSHVSSDLETNGSSPLPATHSYSQTDNFRPIDHERNDSGAASPAEMFRIRPPIFGLSRPPFFAPSFMPPVPPNPFLMGPRFPPMPMIGPQGIISPIPHLITNGSAGGSEANSFEIVDSINITPNSTNNDTHLNGSALSPTPEDEHQTTGKSKKSKKSPKKKTKTSTTTKENV